METRKNKNIQIGKFRVGVMIGYQFPPNVENVTYNLGKILFQKYDLDLISNCDIPNNFNKYFNIHNHVSKPSNKEIINIIKDFINCYRYILNNKPDILFHISKPQIYGSIIAILGKYFNIPIIVRNTGNIFIQYRLETKFLKKILAFIRFNFFGKISFFLADKIICLGKSQKKDLLKKGIKEKKIAIIPQPVNTYKFYPITKKEKIKYRKKLKINKNNKVILYVGKLERLKGTELLISIIKNVIKNRKDITFLIVGDGPLKKNLNKFDKKNVKIIGEVNHVRIDLYYKISDLFLFPSLIEGLPNAILEALASNIPVVATPVGEIPCLISNTFKRTEEFVNYINNGHWKIDKLPDQFHWNNLKYKYIEFFANILG